MRNFKDRVAVITGAGSGIGRALAIELANEGAHLALSDINEDGLAETQHLVSDLGVKVTIEKLDVANRSAFEAHAEQVIRDHGRVNLVFNNAGVTVDSPISDLPHEDLHWLMGINFWGVAHGTQIFLPHLKQSGEGHIINISSVFGIIAVPRQGAYHAAKFAVRGFTECLREELEVEGAPVSATCVHPGGIKTNIARDARVPRRGPEDPTAEELDARFKQAARHTPQKAAQTILKGVRRNKRRVLIGPEAYAIDWIQRLFPTGYQRLVVWAAKREERSRK
jgi:NAD(P)-dependent dehydrogenase (short-subunit alcohol dehydrogenase family)